MPAVLYMQAAEDYKLVLRALRSPKDKPFAVRDAAGNPFFELAEWPQTVVIDSLTDVCRLLIEEIRRQSPQKTGRDGLPSDSERFWNTLGDRFVAFVKYYRDVPMHVLFLCLQDDRMVGEGAEAQRVVRPALAMRKFADELCAAVNLMAVTYRTIQNASNARERKPAYGIMTVGPEYVMTKPYSVLRPVETPNFTDWINRIRGAVTDVKPAPPPPSALSGAGGSGTASAFDNEPEAPEPTPPPAERKAEGDGPALCSVCGVIEVESAGLVCPGCEKSMPQQEQQPVSPATTNEPPPTQTTTATQQQLIDPPTEKSAPKRARRASA
jgi:hypothetical protein